MRKDAVVSSVCYRTNPFHICNAIHPYLILPYSPVPGGSAGAIFAFSSVRETVRKPAVDAVEGEDDC